MRVDQSSFSTLVVPPAERTALWDTYCRENMAPFRVQPLGAGDLRIEIKRTTFAEFEILDMLGDGNVAERIPDLIDGDRQNIIQVGVLLRGKSFIYQPNRIDVLTRGDASLYDLDVPCSYGLSDDFREAVICIPRETFMARYGDSITTEPTVLRSPTPARVAEQSESLLQLAQQARSSDPSSITVAVAACFGFLDTVLGPPSGSATKHWMTAVEQIRAGLHDSRLSGRDVAAAVGLSERQLARVFATRGTTVSRAITDERMRVARERLGDPGQRSRSIFEIAQSVGYQSPSHFARSFRRAFGTSALDFRSRSITRDHQSQPDS